MGGAVSAGIDNDDLVDNLKAANYIKTPLVERIFRAVDRGDYFTSEHREQAYRDNAWKNGNLHLSAPCIYAKVMESLQLEPGHSFLNLGSGTGYLSSMAGLIIGRHGVNHGVELHADVLSYAMDRLEDFKKKKTSGIDAFPFCTPQFVQGNCLCLPPDIRMYDRVYCGASCPESHEDYMKGLIKEGGLLVMPMNDQLVKITRTGPTTWETTSLLPVSFSSLVMPDTSHPPASVALPEPTLYDLQEICRQEIRDTLRTNIDVEHPELATARYRPVQKTTHNRCSGQPFPGVFVPYMPVPFYESEDEDEAGLSSDDNMEDTRENLITFGSPQHNQLTTVIEFAQSLAEQRIFERELRRMRRNVPRRGHDGGIEDDGDDHDDNSPGSASPPRISPFKLYKKVEEKEKTEEAKPSNGESAATSGSTMPQSDPIPVTSTPVMPVKSNKKREKFDSGVGDEIENGKGPSSEDSDQGEEDDVEMEVNSTDSDFSEGSPSRPSRLRNRTRNKVTRLLDPDDPECPCGGECNNSWKDTKDEEAKEDGESQNVITSPAESYSTHMRERIGSLPLPRALKLYLNYNREL